MEILNAPHKTYLVSVCLLTYNHKNYIENAIKSILNQKTNFEFNIIIADDCSTDGTTEIIRKYGKNYPEKITILLQQKNIGANSNFMQMLLFPDCKYIAYIEGDDYWCNDEKLQLQTNYLEKNDNVVLSSHNSNVLLSSGETYLFNQMKKYKNKEINSIYSISDYIERPFFHTSSIFFRKKALKGFPNWFKGVFGGDLFLVLLISMNGDIHYINDTFSTYRINNSSISNLFTRNQIYKNTSLHLKYFDTFSQYQFHKILEERRFFLEYVFYYYLPNYLKKLWFAIKNLKKIRSINPNVISKSSRFNIFIPTFLLKSKVNLFKKR